MAQCRLRGPSCQAAPAMAVCISSSQLPGHGASSSTVTGKSSHFTIGCALTSFEEGDSGAGEGGVRAVLRLTDGRNHCASALSEGDVRALEDVSETDTRGGLVLLSPDRTPSTLPHRTRRGSHSAHLAPEIVTGICSHHFHAGDPGLHCPAGDPGCPSYHVDLFDHLGSRRAGTPLFSSASC